MSSNHKSILKPTQAREPLRTYNQAESEQAWHTPPMEPDAFKARVFEDRLTKLKATRNQQKTGIRNEYKKLLHDETDESRTPDQCMQLIEKRMEKMNEIDDLFDARECRLEEERSRASRSPGPSPDSDVAEPRAQKKKTVRFEREAKCFGTGLPVEPHNTDTKTWGNRQVLKIAMQKMRDANEELQRAERDMKTSLEAYSRSQTPGGLLKHMETVKDAQGCMGKFLTLVRGERDRPIEPRKKIHQRRGPAHRDCYCRLRRDVKPVPALSNVRRETAQPPQNPVHTPVNAGGSVEDNRYAAYNMGAHGQNVQNNAYNAYNAGANTKYIGNNYNGAYNTGTNANYGANNYNVAYNMATNANYDHNAYNMGANANYGENNYNVPAYNMATNATYGQNNYPGAYNTGTNANHGYNAYNAGANANYVENNYNGAYNTGTNANHGHNAYNAGANANYDYNAYNAYNPYAAYHTGPSHAAYDGNAYSGSIENNNYAASNMGTHGGASLDEGPGHTVYTTVDEYADVENYGYEVDMSDADEDAEGDGDDGGSVVLNGHSASGMGTNGGASLNAGPAGRVRARDDDDGFSPSSPEMPTKRRKTHGALYRPTAEKYSGLLVSLPGPVNRGFDDPGSDDRSGI